MAQPNRLHDETPPERLKIAFELHDLGVAMTAQSLRRQHPDATDEQIQGLVDEWLATRPGAEDGDGPGTPVPLSRFR